MPFDDDVREPSAELFANRPRAAAMHELLVAPDAIESAAMSAFCASLSPDDWVALEGLGARVRNALLKRTVAIALRWRARRAKRAEQPTRLVGAEREQALAGLDK